MSFPGSGQLQLTGGALRKHLFLRARTRDNAGNQAGWTTLFCLQYDDQPPLITDQSPAHGAVVTTTARPLISASLSDPTPGSGVQPRSTTLMMDSQAVTPQVSTASGFVYTLTQALTEGSHAMVARAHIILRRWLYP